ncbi:MAG: MFS transporter [Clostridium sp.]|uniref:MFS transporter n=1 Tax=Clostridium culturomicium TaxID=1499683 RepID=UPI002911916B|nr:MFS transporter [Clostridium sp.]MDU7085115.1 MFS transporter [Clostridium sp.]
MKNTYENNFKLRLILILTSLSTGVMSFFLPIYSKALDMNALEISGLFSITAFILIILRPFIGKLIDKVGRKPILVLAVFIYAIAYLIFSMATTSVLLYTARALQGIASAFMGISIYAIVADNHDSNNISKGFGKVNSAQSTGNIYGCILAFIVLYRVSFLKGWKILFVIFAVAALFALFKVITTFKESKNTYVNKRINIKNYSKSTLKLLIIVFITSLSSAMVAPVIMIFLQDKITTDISGLALAFFPSLLIASLLSEKLGTISDKLGKNKSMIIGMLICGGTYLILPTLSSVLLFMVIWTISSLGGILYDLSESGLYAQLNTENDNGEIFGVYTLVCDFGRMIGPLIGGALYKSLSQSLPFYLYGIIMIFVAVLIPILLKETKKEF